MMARNHWLRLWGLGPKAFLGFWGMANLRVTHRRGTTEDDPDRLSERWRDLHVADKGGGRHAKVSGDAGPVVIDSSRRERGREAGEEGSLGPTTCSLGATFKKPEVWVREQGVYVFLSRQLVAERNHSRSSSMLWTR